MAKEHKQMTRIVAIGTLKSGEYKEEMGMYKGSIDTGKGNIQFVFFNAKATAQNPHTKAADFAKAFKPQSEDYAGDRVFVTGTDSRNYSEEKDTHYESIQGWDYRAAEEDEIDRWVYVYVADVIELEDNLMTLSFTNYKDEETKFPIVINSTMTKIDGELEVGARVKVKGNIFNGLKMDFFGDGEYVVERTAVEVKVLHSAEEMEEINAPAEEAGNDSALWD